MKPSPPVSTKQPSTIETIPQFSETLIVRHRTAVCRLGVAKEKYKETKTSNVLWPNIKNRRSHTKIDQKLR